MKQQIEFNREKFFNELQEGGRIYYATPTLKGWNALREGKPIKVFGEFSATGWVLLFLEIDGKEYQLTKKQVRASDLPYILGTGAG